MSTFRGRRNRWTHVPNILMDDLRVNGLDSAFYQDRGGGGGVKSERRSPIPVRSTRTVPH
jgi:hypothetical protein